MDTPSRADKMLADIVQANVDSLAFTTNALIAGEKQQSLRLAYAFRDLYDAVEMMDPISRRLLRKLDALEDIRYMSDRIIADVEVSN